MANRIPQRSIFWEEDGQVFLVNNWRNRFVKSARPVLLRLGPKHLKQYRDSRGLGRSDKSIYYLLFKKSVVLARRPRRTAGTEALGAGTRIPVRIDLLTAEQLAAIASELLGHEVLGLRPLGLKQLRILVLDLHRHTPATH